MVRFKQIAGGGGRMATFLLAIFYSLFASPAPAFQNGSTNGPVTVAPRGPAGPANNLSIGTVTTVAPGLPAGASISGTPPSQTLNLSIPQGATGATGPANSLSIGTVTNGGSAAASITGTAPAQVLNLTLPAGPTGVTGAIGATGATGASILSGAGAPSSGTGNNGDFYLNTTSTCLYGPKASGSWPGTCTSLVGSGTITGVTAGSGLTGGGSSGSVTVALDATQGNAGGVQQTVQSGPDSSGVPSFWPTTSGSLSLTLQNVSSSAPLVLNAWAAPGSSGNKTLTCALTSNSLTWSSLTASSTLFLYATLSTSGGSCTVTAAFTAQVPIYQWGGSPSTTSGQITCNIAERQCYLGNGSSAPQTTLVVLGEVVTSGSVVTSTVPYAYNGYYDSGWTQNLPGTSTSVSFNINLGFKDALFDIIAECTTATQGYSVGDQFDGLLNGGFFTAGGTRNQCWISTYSSSPNFIPKGGGGSASATTTSWKYKLVAKRRW